MTKKIKLALGLIGGIGLVSAIAPIVVSCSNDNGPNGDGKPNGPNDGGENGDGGPDTNPGLPNPPVASGPYSPSQEAMKIIPREKFEKIKENLRKTCIFMNVRYKFNYSVNEYYLKENKFYFSLIDLNSNNVLGSFDCNLSPNVENKYSITYITSNITVNEMNNQEPQPHTINLTREQLDLLLYYFENTSIINEPFFDYIDPPLKKYSKELEQITRTIIKTIHGNKGWSYNDVHFEFKELIIHFRFNLYDDNLKQFMGHSYNFIVEDKTASKWRLEYFYAKGKFNGQPDKNGQVTKILTNEQVVAFFKEIYTNKRLPSIDEIGNILPTK